MNTLKYLILSLAVILITETTLVSSKSNIKEIFEKYEGSSFSFENCGPDDDVIKINSMSLQPIPLKLPGKIIADGDTKISKNVTGPVSASLKIYKMVGNYKLQIPCPDHFCHFDDVCSMLPSNNDACPDFLKKNNIPCSCPFPKGDYSAKGYELDIALPLKVPGGQYTIVINLNNHELGHIGCFNMEVLMA